MINTFADKPATLSLGAGQLAPDFSQQQGQFHHIAAGMGAVEAAQVGDIAARQKQGVIAQHIRGGGNRHLGSRGAGSRAGRAGNRGQPLPASQGHGGREGQCMHGWSQYGGSPAW